MEVKKQKAETVSDEDRRKSKELTAKIVNILKQDGLQSEAIQVMKNINCDIIGHYTFGITLLKYALLGNCSEEIIPLLLHHPLYDDDYMEEALGHAIQEKEISDDVLCEMIACEHIPVNSWHLIHAIECNRSAKIIDALLKRPEVDKMDIYQIIVYYKKSSVFITAINAEDEETIIKLINHRSYTNLDNHLNRIIEADIKIQKSLFHVLDHFQLYLQPAGENVADINVFNIIFEKVMTLILKRKSLEEWQAVTFFKVIFHEQLSKNLVNTKFAKGFTLWHIFACLDRIPNDSKLTDIWLKFYEMKEMNPNVQEKDGYTPAMLALMNLAKELPANMEIKAIFSSENGSIQQKKEFLINILVHMVNSPSFDMSVKNKYAQNTYDINGPKPGEAMYDKRITSLIRSAWDKHEQELKSKNHNECFTTKPDFKEILKLMQNYIGENEGLNAVQKEDLLSHAQFIEAKLNKFKKGHEDAEIGMSNVNREKLRNCHRYLLQNITVSPILDCLYGKSVITEVQMEEIKVLKVRPNMIRELLLLLPTRGEKAFGVFLEALRAEDQDYIAEYLEKYDPGAEEDSTDECQELVPFRSSNNGAMSIDSTHNSITVNRNDRSVLIDKTKNVIAVNLPTVFINLNDSNQ